VPAADAEAVHGERRDGGAVRRVAAGARAAGPAADLERDDDALAGADRLHLVPHGEDFGDAFVPKAERERERCASEDERTVEVARGGGDRVNDGASRPRGRWGRDAAPAQASAGCGDERPHPRARGPQALAQAVAHGLAQPAQALVSVALERHPPGRQRHRREHRRRRAHAAPRPMRAPRLTGRAEHRQPLLAAHAGTPGAHAVSRRDIRFAIRTRGLPRSSFTSVATPLRRPLHPRSRSRRSEPQNVRLVVVLGQAIAAPLRCMFCSASPLSGFRRVADPGVASSGKSLLRDDDRQQLDQLTAVRLR
jgi:hypothetical protein